MDNADDFTLKAFDDFTSKAFDDYCMTLGIKVEHPIHYVHTQNGLAESLIMRIKLIVILLLQHSDLPISCWGYVVLHADALIQIRPIAYRDYSPLQIVHGKKPNISHLRIFGCSVYVPISPPNRTSMGPQRKLGIYIGYESPSILKYLELITRDQFTARYVDYIFDEDHFPALGGDKNQKLKECLEISWNLKDLQYLDPCTSQIELEVQKIINLQYLVSNLLDAFTGHKGVTKSHIPAINTPQRVEVPKGSSISIDAPQCQKHGRPIGAKNKNPRKTKSNKETMSLPESLDENCLEDNNPSTFAHAPNNHNARTTEND